MSYKTVEVELKNGSVRPLYSEALPDRATALLTILQTDRAQPAKQLAAKNGLGRFLSEPGFGLSPEQFQESMDSDFWEQ